MTEQLLLKRASTSRPSGEWNDDDYDVLADSVVVGSYGGSSCTSCRRRSRRGDLTMRPGHPRAPTRQGGATLRCHQPKGQRQRRSARAMRCKTIATNIPRHVPATLAAKSMNCG